MLRSLGKIDELRTVLGRLNAERKAAYGESSSPETRYVQRADKLHRQLALEVESRQGKARVLLTGQIGVGKSSELWRFVCDQRQQNDGTWVIACDLEKEEHPERCSATGVLLTIFRDCWAAGRNKHTGQSILRTLRTKILAKLIDWLKGNREENDKVVFKFGGMDFAVYLNRPDDALSLILGKAAQHEAVSKPSDRFGLLPDTLINLLNEFLDWLSFHGKRPLIVVDHVDKIRDVDAAEDVLVKSVPQWSRIRASIVMTAPYEHTLGELRNSIESKWGKPLMVSPVAIPESFPFKPGESIDPIFLSIAKNAGLNTLIGLDSLGYLAYYSGGILRTYVQFLIDACKEAHLSKQDKIDLSAAESVVQSAQMAYKDFSVLDLELLDGIASNETGLGEASKLLRSPIGLLVRETSQGLQLRVHPLAESAIAKHRLRKELA
jgi:hypothetical protein